MLKLYSTPAAPGSDGEFGAICIAPYLIRVVGDLVDLVGDLADLLVGDLVVLDLPVGDLCDLDLPAQVDL